MQPDTEIERAAIVTGAVRGIGRAVAMRLARDGYRVVVNFRGAEAEAAQVVGPIQEFGGVARPIRADVTDAEEVGAMIEGTVNPFGRLDVLVHNAGLFEKLAFEDIGLEAYRRMQAVNVEAQLRDPHSLLHWMRRILAVRSRSSVIGRGSMRLLYPGNRKILAYLRGHEDSTALCVFNLSRSPQAVELGLSALAGRGPGEGLGGTASSDPLVSRNGASGGFGKLNLELGRVQNLQPGLYGVLRGSAQFATQPLYLAEQFAVGGPDTVRGFAQAELLGDEGYVVSAELRWSPIEDEPDRFQMAFFVDHGGVSLKRAGPGDLPRGSKLTGAGLGFRLGLGAASTARVDIGFPISPASNSINASPAVYCGVQTRF